ncbi:MAG TPA: hypothetical protein VGF82_12565 [Terracidiphilus sp.]|jgi:hypothetical protein
MPQCDQQRKGSGNHIADRPCGHHEKVFASLERRLARNKPRHSINEQKTSRLEFNPPLALPKPPLEWPHKEGAQLHAARKAGSCMARLVDQRDDKQYGEADQNLSHQSMKNSNVVCIQPTLPPEPCTETQAQCHAVCQAVDLRVREVALDRNRRVALSFAQSLRRQGADQHSSQA